MAGTKIIPKKVTKATAVFLGELSSTVQLQTNVPFTSFEFTFNIALISSPKPANQGKIIMIAATLMELLMRLYDIGLRTADHRSTVSIRQVYTEEIASAKGM
jgi:hypothetical protein